jgi:hypothetical protein
MKKKIGWCIQMKGNNHMDDLDEEFGTIKNGQFD